MREGESDGREGGREAGREGGEQHQQCWCFTFKLRKIT